MKELVSHYRVIRELGRGGMGEVYLAEDTRLRRMVALKTLPQGAVSDARRLQRFLREAHAASALNHPNVAIIHEIAEDDGMPFIAMEYVDGPTLAAMLGQGPLDIQRISSIGLQIADALEEARVRGIVHRDLKPANIIINARGDAKVLDFGLAKLAAGEAETDPAGATDVKSDPALIVGTVQYMSPEQALGRDVDHRSDLFSFGVVLYEMATARHPFAGKSTTETVERIVHAQPEAVARFNYEVPPELERIIRKCLEKDRESRYQSAREIVVDLKNLRRDSGSGEVPLRPAPRRLPLRLAAIAAIGIAGVAAWVTTRPPAGSQVTAPSETITSIAVLPFSTMTAAAPLDYLKFALPDEVTTILSGSPSLAVRPFASTRRFETADPIEAGRLLSAAKVVTGHYRADGGTLAVTIEAIDVAANRVIWRDTTTLPAADLLAVRNDLSGRLRTGLLPALGIAAREEGSRPQNEEAYTLFLRASSLPRDPEPTREAIPMLERAVALDPTYAAAWVELGRRHYVSGSYGDAGNEGLDRARTAFARARSIDPDSAGSIRGLIIALTERGDLAAAYREGLQAVRRRPRDADVRYALAYTLRYAGRYEDAARQCDIAWDLDRSPTLRACFMPFFFLQRYDRGRDFLNLERGSVWTDTHVVGLLMREGKKAEAAALLRRRPELYGPLSERLVRCLEGGPSDTEPQSLPEARTRSTVDPEPFYFYAAESAFCGRRDDALALLRTALEKKYSIYPAIDRDPAFDTLRDDPDFLRIRSEAMRYHEEAKALLRNVERETGTLPER